jgi:Protein of unknown function (DUF3634)
MMRYLNQVIVASLVVCAVCGGIWIFQARTIADYESELRGRLRQLEQEAPPSESLPPEFDTDLKLFWRGDPRARWAEQVQRCALAVGALATAVMLAATYYQNTLVFLIVFSRGVAHVRAGKVTKRFADEVGALVQESGLSEATVWARRVGSLVRLGFSSTVPPSLRQRLRNLWALAGTRSGVPGGKR